MKIEKKLSYVPPSLEDLEFDCVAVGKSEGLNDDYGSDDNVEI